MNNHESCKIQLGLIYYTIVAETRAVIYKNMAECGTKAPVIKINLYLCPD